MIFLRTSAVISCDKRSLALLVRLMNCWSVFAAEICKVKVKSSQPPDECKVRHHHHSSSFPERQRQRPVNLTQDLQTMGPLFFSPPSSSQDPVSHLLTRWLAFFMLHVYLCTEQHNWTFGKKRFVFKLTVPEIGLDDQKYCSAKIKWPKLLEVSFM